MHIILVAGIYTVLDSLTLLEGGTDSLCGITALPLFATIITALVLLHQI